MITQHRCQSCCGEQKHKQLLCSQTRPFRLFNLVSLLGLFVLSKLLPGRPHQPLCHRFHGNKKATWVLRRLWNLLSMSPSSAPPNKRAGLSGPAQRPSGPSTPVMLRSCSLHRGAIKPVPPPQSSHWPNKAITFSALIAVCTWKGGHSL